MPGYSESWGRARECGRRPDERVPMPQSRQGGRVRLCMVALLAFLMLGAVPDEGARGFPEIVRLRVPESKAISIFPEGGQLRRLSAEAFEDLVEAAREGARRRAGHSPARLIRVTHYARWVDGTLVGRSELLIDGPGDPPAPLALIPWSPAVRGAETDLEIRTASDGTTSLWVDRSGRFTTSVSWVHGARPGSGGRTFDLELPAGPVARLELELPDGLIPESSRGLGLGSAPEPAAGSGCRLWSFDGAEGALELRLQATRATMEPSIWVRGLTEIEVEGASASWCAEWVVERTPDAPRLIHFEIDPGLAIVDVTGDDILGFETEAVGEATRLTVSLSSAAGVSTRVAARALARLPDVGPWIVPAARPLTGVWTGERTRLRVGRDRTLISCRELSGIRVPEAEAEAEESGEARRVLVFEARSPRSVAEITFGRSTMEATAEVHGEVFLGRQSTRVEATTAWRVSRGPVLALPIDLPAGWKPDVVQLEGLDEPTTWNVQWRGDGGPRVVVQPPSSYNSTGLIEVRLTATAAPGQAGPVAMPRVRPPEVRITEELWVARTEAGREARPVQARGVAWVEPPTATASHVGPTSIAPSTPSPLAWRWVDQDGRLSIEAVEQDDRLVAECWTVATLEPRELTLDWYLHVVGESRSRRSLIFAINESIQPPAWYLLGDETEVPLPCRRLVTPPAGSEGPDLAARYWWELELPSAPASGRFTLHARSTQPWEGRGSLPLLALPPWAHARGAAAVFVDPSLKLFTRSEGLSRIEAGASKRSLGELQTGGDRNTGEEGPTRQFAQAFEYGPSSGRLEAQTELLSPVASGGVILDARIIDWGWPPGSMWRLALEVMPGPAQTLEITLPPGASLLRAISGPRPLQASRRGDAISVALPIGSGSRPVVSLVLDYRCTSVVDAVGRDISATWPRFSLPCLSVTREVRLPRGTELVHWDTSMVSADPARSIRPSRTDPLLESRWPLNHSPVHNTSMWRDLEERNLRSHPTNATTLGEWLTRLDGGRWPLVVDRLALQSAGIGPDSRSEWPPSGKPSLDVALRAYGLAAVPLGGALLVTTPRDMPRPIGDGGATEAAWADAVEEASTRGYDRVDRLQAVYRWRGEPTPQSFGIWSDFGPDDGWQFDRWTASTYRTNVQETRLSDGWFRRVVSWAMTLAVALIGVGLRRASQVAATWVAASVVSLGLLSYAFAGGWIAELGPALSVGCLAAAAYWYGTALRPRFEGVSRRGSTDPRRRAAVSSPRGGASRVLLIVASVAATTGHIAADPADRVLEAPILVALPYEGTADLTSEPEQVLMLLSDYDRLRTMTSQEETEVSRGPWVVEARHQLVRANEDLVRFASEYLLRAGAERTASWKVPLGAAVGLRATLDDREVPIRVLPGGAAATISLLGGGPRRLRLSGDIPIGPDGMTHLPICPAATASFEALPQDGDEAVEVIGAFGATGRPRIGVGGAIGPAASLDVRWSKVSSFGAPPGTVEGLFLWDIEPAGDRLRGRLTHRGPGVLSELRLRLEPGLTIRSGSFAGWTQGTWSGPEDRPVWSVPLFPPLVEGESVDLEFWRAGLGTLDQGGEVRVMPQVAIADGPGRSGLVGVRVSDPLVATMEPAAVEDLVLTELFSRTWGTLPDGPGRLAGAVSWAHSLGVAAYVAPSKARPTIRPSLRVELTPGRAELRLEATCVEHAARLRELSILLPPGVQLSRVEADGLASWNESSDGRVRLVLDPIDRDERLVRLQGWQPAGPAHSGSSGQAQEVSLPWPTWPEADVEDGLVSIVGPSSSRFRVDELRELTAVRPSGPDDATAIRAAYRVTGASPSGLIRWSVEPPRANVLLRSHLTFYPEDVEWVAMARYQMSGGPTTSVRLEMPSEWAGAADIEASRGSPVIRREGSGGRTVVTLDFEEPLWGSVDLLFRGRRSLTEEGLSFPDLVPLGNGQVTSSYLAWVDLSGRRLAAEGSAGLQQVDASRFDLDRLPVPRRAERRVYQVLRSGWSLRIKGTGPRPGEEPVEGSRHVALSEVTCNLAADGSVVGLVRFDLGFGSAPMLKVRVPPALEALVTTVDGVSVRPWRDARGDYLVPLGEGEASKVALFWRGRADGGALRWPVAAGPGNLSLIAVHAPESIAVFAAGGGLAAQSGEDADLDRVEHRCRTIGERLGRLDRSAPGERAALIGELEWVLAQVHRLGRAVASGRASAGAGRISARLRELESGLSRTLTEAGLDASLQAARSRLGLRAESEAGSGPERSEALPEARLHRLGRPTYFRMAGGVDEGRGPALRWVRVEGSRDWSRLGPPLLGLALVPPCVVAALRCRRRRLLGLLSAPIAGVAVLMGAAPAVYTLWIGSFGAGLLARR